MKTFVIALAALMSTVAYSAGEDLERCLYNNGIPMDPRVCASLNKHAALKAEEQVRMREHRERQRELANEQRAQSEAKQQEAQREREVKQAEWRAKKDEEHAMGLKAQQEQIRWEKATAKAASERTAKQKFICGEDYRSPRVGMTLVRAKECVADFKLKGQINRADGVVSTYMAGQTYLHVMGGKIVSWGR